jgi:hypothetical protein
MSRTKGSGWGGGIMLYQSCPKCGKKKALYDPLPYSSSFKCTYCKERFMSDTLIKSIYPQKNIENLKVHLKDSIKNKTYQTRFGIACDFPQDKIDQMIDEAVDEYFK